MQKLRGYLTPSGWFGEIARDVWRMFDTEEEWKAYIGEDEEADEKEE